MNYVKGCCILTLVIFLLLTLFGCQSRNSIPEPKLTSLHYRDFRGDDLSDLDLSGEKDLAKWLNFSSQTVFPAGDHAARGLSPEDVLKMGKDPGLGLRNLHRQGITGEGINVAVIDKPIIQNHSEFTGRMIYHVVSGKGEYREVLHDHGIGAASILAGATTGVAPRARIRYFAISNHVPYFPKYAEALRQILAFNEGRSPEDQIKVVSISHGSGEGLEELNQVIEEAQTKGIIVVKPEKDYGALRFFGGRLPLGQGRQDPEGMVPFSWNDANINLYTLLLSHDDWEDGRSTLVQLLEQGKTAPRSNFGGIPSLDIVTKEKAVEFLRSWDRWQTAGKSYHEFFQDMLKGNERFTREAVLVPAESMTTASIASADAYIYWGSGGLSWATPYLAGVFTLGLQINPDFDPQQLYRIIVDTAVRTEKGHWAIDPVAAVERVQRLAGER
ncbi:MAG TPA: S8 family serine peptidase [Anaerolineales bacterium]